MIARASASGISPRSSTVTPASAIAAATQPPATSTRASVHGANRSSHCACSRQSRFDGPGTNRAGSRASNASTSERITGDSPIDTVHGCSVPSAPGDDGCW